MRALGSLKAQEERERESAKDAAQAAPAVDVPEDVQEARDALRALESDPVIKIKPAPSEEPEESDFPSDIDPRTAGSGNIGATNVGRLLGGKFFGIVFTLDFLKGLLPSLAASCRSRTPSTR